MKKIILVPILCMLTGFVMSQNLHIGVFGGASAYLGDLTDKIFPKKLTNGVVGLTGTYEIADQLAVRGGVTYTIVGGADRYSEKADLRQRNLSFETKIYEVSAMGEYYLMNLYEKRFSPFVMAGLAVFKFDPYTYYNGDKIYLRPLSTEGQGISGYGKKYSKTQIALPFGGGVKFAVTDNLRVGVEGSLRKLFTDYLDDASGFYADPADLLAAKGQLSVDLSYRGDEAGGSPAYPSKGFQRGSPKSKDYYYFVGLHVSYRVGGNRGGGMFGGKSGGKNKTGCPVNIY